MLNPTLKQRCGLLVATLTAATAHAGCQDDPFDIGSMAEELGGIEGTFEYAIDAPWRIEPTQTEGYGAIPINIAIHDVMLDAEDGSNTGFRGARFDRVVVREALPNGNVRTQRFNFPDLEEVEATRGCWAPTHETLGSDSAVTQRLPCSAEPDHRICREPGSCDANWFADLDETSEWHGVLWYTPHPSFDDPGRIVPLTVDVWLRGSTDEGAGNRFVRLRNHLRVELAEDPLPTFGEGWLYGDLHYHSQGSDNEGESAYNYRNVVRAMGALGMDFVFATDHASDSEQMADVDVDLQVLDLELHDVTRILGGLLRDMNDRRFIHAHGLINGADGANAQAAAEASGTRMPQSSLSHGVIPQIYLGGEVDAVPEVTGPDISHGQNLTYSTDTLCNGWHDTAQLPSCPTSEILKPAQGGHYLVRDVQGFNDFGYGRNHLVYLPRTSDLYIDGELSFVSSRTGKYGGAGRRLERWLDGHAPLLPEIATKGYAFIAHPFLTSAAEGPDGPPWSEYMLRKAWRSPAILGLQLWNEDGHRKTEVHDGVEEIGYERPLDLDHKVPSDGRRPGFNTRQFELVPFDITHGRFAETIIDEWKRNQAIFEWDTINLWGLDPTQTSGLSWLPRGEPRRMFMAGGSDAHGDINFHRSGYFLGTTSVTDSGMGKPRNMVFAGQAATSTPAGDRYAQAQVVDALVDGHFAVTDGPALRMVVDRTGNDIIDDEMQTTGAIDDDGAEQRPDIGMGGVGHFYSPTTTVPVLIDWISTAEFGMVDRIEISVGVRCANGAIRRFTNTVNVAPAMRGTLNKEYTPSSMVCGNDLTASPVTGFFVRATARTQRKSNDCAAASNDALDGKCIRRYAYTNPIWMMAAEIEPFTCKRDFRSLDFDNNGLPDDCQADDIVGITYYEPLDTIFTFRRGGMVHRGDQNDLDADGTPYSYTLPSGKMAADIVGMAYCGKEMGVSRRLYTWYRDGTVSEGTNMDLDSLRAPYRFTAAQDPTHIAYVTCAEPSSTGRFFAYYKDGTYSTGRADTLDYYEGLAPYTLPDGKLPSDIVGMVFPKDWWRTLAFFRGSGTHGTLANGLYMNLSFYPAESYHYPLVAMPVGGAIGGVSSGFSASIPQ